MSRWTGFSCNRSTPRTTDHGPRTQDGPRTKPEEPRTIARALPRQRRARDEPRALANGDQLIGRDVPDRFNATVRPPHFDEVRHGGGTQPDVHTHIVLAQITGPGFDVAPLGARAGGDADARTDCIA